MSDTVIQIESISKCYRLGARQESRDTLAGALVQTIRMPIDNLRRVRNLTRFDRGNTQDILWALRDVSFEVRSGDVVGLIGRNGAGKSTLLKVLSRITPPTSGHIKLCGRVASLLEVGTGFHPELTGRENVYLNGAILGMTRKEIQSKFDEIISFAEVEKFVDTPVKFFSSGMRVRLAFAVAAHLEPEILIVDEVLAVGDASFQRKSIGKMGEVSKCGRTVLFVSHNMTALQSLCTRGVLLDKGTVHLRGSIQEVVNKYLAEGTTAIHERVWDQENSPGDDFAFLSRASIQGDFEEMITIEDWIRITVEVHIKRPVRILVNLILRTFSDEVVFEAPTEPFSATPKNYSVSFTIPAHLLNAESYKIQINIVDVDSGKMFHAENALNFEVSEVARNEGYMGRLCGHVRPKLEYQIFSQ